MSAVPPYRTAIQGDIMADRAPVTPTGRAPGMNVQVPHVRLNGPGSVATSIPLNKLRGDNKGYRNKQLPSNTYMQCTYLVNKQRDANADLMKGMLYFIAKQTNAMKVNERSFLLNTAVSIGQLNAILFKARNTVSRKHSENTPAYVDFVRILGEHSENAINRYWALKEHEEHNRKALEEEGADLARLYALCQQHQDMLLCTTPLIVLDTFKFGGVVLGYSTDNSVQGPGMLQHTEHYRVLNGIISGVAEAHDVFTPGDEMCVGARLFLHVHRRPSPTGHFAGSFVVDPVVMNTLNKPDVAYKYTDPHGIWCSGVLEEIGQVHYNKDRTDGQVTQHRASGVEPTLDLTVIQRNTAMLAKITVSLNKRK